MIREIFTELKCFAVYDERRRACTSERRSGEILTLELGELHLVRHVRDRLCRKTSRRKIKKKSDFELDDGSTSSSASIETYFLS